MSNKVGLAVFISGGGTNLQSIIDCCADGSIPAEVRLVVSNKSNAFGLERAKKAGINTFVFVRKQFPDEKTADNHLLAMMEKHKVELIALAGYLKMIPPALLERYHGRIVNIHPGLLPQYGGKGMYGLNVHRAVIEAREKETGVTIHQVDEIYDHGKVLAEERVPVFPEDTPEELAVRVLKVEHRLYPQVLKEISEKIIKERQ